MSGVGRLKFKGEKSKKKKRSHREKRDDGDELDALAREDPRGWMFPAKSDEVTGPTLVVFPTEPLSCLAWDPTRERVCAAPLDLPQAPEGFNELSPAEVLSFVEPSDVNHVWVVSRLAGSNGVSLRSAAGGFLSALPSGKLDVSASRGPLESFITEVLPSDSAFPGFALKSEPSGKYLLADKPDEDTVLAKKTEIRCDADEPQGGIRAKCQREFVLKARVQQLDGKDSSKRRLLERDGPEEGSVEDELRRNSQYQAWGGGVHKVSDKDRRELKRAKKDGRVAEAMLDRRAKMKSDKYC